MRLEETSLAGKIIVRVTIVGIRTHSHQKINVNHPLELAISDILYTYYNVSGGPIISTSQRYISLSSIRPAENPSTGFLFNSERKKKKKNGKSSIQQT